MKHHYLRFLRAPLLAALTLLASTLHTATALADEGSVEHAKKARVAYDLQDFPTAVQEYRAAYASEKRAEYLFGLAQAQRQAKDYAGAIATFKAYKRSDGVTPEQSTAAELLITKCEVDQARAEAAASKPGDPPRDSARGGSDGKPSVTPHGGDRAPAPLAAPSAPEPSAGPTRRDEPRRPTEPRRFYQDALGDTLFIAGLGASGVGAALLLSGNSGMNAAANAPTEAEARRAADSAHPKQVAGAVLLPIGGALLVGGIVRWITCSNSSEASTSAGLLIGPQYLGYSGRF